MSEHCNHLPPSSFASFTNTTLSTIASIVMMNESVRRRKRPAIRRKIRCNRETPCSNCIRSKITSCIYETDSVITNLSMRNGPPQIQPRQSTAAQSFPYVTGTASHSSVASLTELASTLSSPSDVGTMRARIAELEDKLSRTESSTAPSSQSVSAASPGPTRPVETSTSLAGMIDVLQDTRTFGRTTAISRAIAHKNRVFGQSHWMNGFMVYRDLIELMEPHLRTPSSSILSDMHRAKILARAVKKQRSPVWPTLPDKSLPSREVCDKLVDAYLRTIENVYRILHIPGFRREYESIWSSSSEPTMPVVIQLKLVLAIGATFFDDDFSMRTQATRWIYEAQTWLASPTFKSRLGIQYLQTNVLLLLARDFVDVGSELVWISAGSVVRAAIYVGLHKDPSRLPRMNPFESEMRRRLWNTIVEVTLQSSMESGGPALLSMEDFDTAAPGNYDDDMLATMDFNTQPSTQFTQTSFSIALRRTLPARLAVVKFLNDNASMGSFDETLRLDAELRSSYKILRRMLQAYQKPDSDTHQFGTCAVEFIMQRYVSSLHQPLFAMALRDPIYAYSRKAVVDASLNIWRLAHPSETTGFSKSESDLSRLCRCGAGFFRAFAFHAATFIGAEARTLIEDEEGDLNVASHQITLMTVVSDASKWYLKCMEAGETGMKGYLLLQLLSTQIDGIKNGVDMAELPSLLVKAAENASATCLRILEVQAGIDQNPTTDSGADVFDFEISPEVTEDWDMIMSDVFNFGTYGDSLDSFLL